MRERVGVADIGLDAPTERAPALIFLRRYVIWCAKARCNAVDLLIDIAAKQPVKQRDVARRQNRGHP